MHYQRVRRTGSAEPTAARIDGNPVDRFWAHVDKNGPLSLRKGAPGRCWTWVARSYRSGYGCLTIHGKKVLAHRFAYDLLVAAIPAGLLIDHRCRNRFCVNPEHLEPVTTGENTRRGLPGQTMKTHCKNGHAFTPDNTYVEIKRGRRSRKCRTCVREYNRHYYGRA